MTLAAAFAEWERALLALGLSIPRILLVFTVLPFLGKSVLPGLVRNAFVIACALVLWPLVQSQLPTELPGIPALVAVIAKEAFLGLLIGYSFSIVYWAIQSVGFFIDTQRGASIAGALVPTFGDQSSLLGVLLTQTITVFFFVSGGFLLFLESLFQSYLTWPVFSLWPHLGSEGAAFFLGLFDLLMYITAFLAAPMVLVMFLVDLSLGLMGRFVPQLNVFFLAMPIKSAVTIFILVLYLATIINFFGNEIREIAGTFTRLEGLLR